MNAFYALNSQLGHQKIDNRNSFDNLEIAL